MEPKDIIKQAREKQGLTQSQLADIVGVSSRMIQRYEEGKFPKFKSEKIKMLDEELGTSIYDIIYDKLNDTDNTYLDQYIEQLEARRKDAEETARKMEAHYKDMKEALERAQTTINEVLKPIKDQTQEILVNSKEMAEDIEALTNEIQAEHRAMMDSIDVAAKQPIGTTRAAAGTVELASQDEHVNKGKIGGVGRKAGLDKKD